VRPGMARREDRLRFWALIAAGLSSEDAAIGAGCRRRSGPVGFGRLGGMPSSTFAPSSKPLSGRYLAFAAAGGDRARACTGLWSARDRPRLGRAASTVSRELRRNAATRSGGLEYRASTAQWHAERSARRPKRAKLRSTRRCGRMCRIGWPARSLPRTELRFAGRSCRGRDAGMGRDRSGDGVWREPRADCAAFAARLSWR